MDLILDLFFRPERVEKQDGAFHVYNHLHFVINYLKEDSVSKQSSVIWYYVLHIDSSFTHAGYKFNIEILPYQQYALRCG